MDPTSQDIQNLTAAINQLTALMTELFTPDLDLYGVIAVGSLTFFVSGFVLNKVVSLMRRY
ncbi:hypothetical protein Misp06_01087 [Microbulbifer sp. NBRC 101763]|uniref:hypothetical protein n=1 Tax=Microbulbifer sp. NBRC 101763 TaxID=1113820 RepID=UPI0030B22130